MKTLFFTKQSSWLKKWDDFLRCDPKGSHLVCSDWLKSYQSYGFDYEVALLLNEENTIIGGFGVVIPKFSFFKFYIIPHGPIFTKGYYDVINDCIIQLKSRAKSLKCCYIQFSVPVSDVPIVSEITYSTNAIDLEGMGFTTGKLFKQLYSSYGLNWLDCTTFAHEIDLQKALPSHAKRNLKKAYKSELVLEEAKTEKTIEEAYQLVTLNAKSSGYNVRNYIDIKDTIVNMVNKDLGVFFVVKKDGKIKGSAFFAESAHFLTYIFGGTVKEKPGYSVGYFLHWEAIKRSYGKSYKGYNISMGGSQGVLRFKSQFLAEQLFFESPHYYSVLNKPIFNLYKFLETHLKSHKKWTSKVLAFLNRN